MWESVYTSLQEISPISREEWIAFRELAEFKAVKKNSHLIRAGEFADSIGVCVSGLFRLYYITPDGDEFNKSFCAKHDFVASYSSLLLNSPSFFSIQALMNSELVVIGYRELQSLYSRHVGWERLSRVLIEHLYVKKETREQELLMFSAEDRYAIFLKKYGHMIKHIPQYQIASYLGTTPVALSRIRKKINLG